MVYKAEDRTPPIDQLAPSLGHLVRVYIAKRTAALFDKKAIDDLILRTIQEQAVVAARNACHSWRMEDEAKRQIQNNPELRAYLAEQVHLHIKENYFSTPARSRELHALFERVIRDFQLYSMREAFQQRVIEHLTALMEEEKPQQAAKLVQRLAEEFERRTGQRL
jgi:hypothetical protein